MARLFAAFSIMALLAGLLVSADQSTETLTQVIEENDDLSTLLVALEQSGVDVDSDPVTLCSPINQAFEKLEPARLNQLLSDEFIAHLQDLLDFHAIPGKTLASAVFDGLQATTRNGEDLFFKVRMVDGQTIVLVDSPNTAGEGAQVVEADLESANGVAHKLDAVLLPSFWNRTLFDTIRTTGVVDELNIMTELIELSGLEDRIPAEAVATILGPTDAAFEALGQAALDFYKDPANKDELLALLGNHVVINKVLPAQNLQEGQEIQTLGGTALTVSVTDSTEGEQVIAFDEATVLAADALANNGIVHSVNQVLLVESAVPSTPAPTEPMSAAPFFNGFVTASSVGFLAAVVLA